MYVRRLPTNVRCLEITLKRLVNQSKRLVKVSLSLVKVFKALACVVDEHLSTVDELKCTVDTYKSFEDEYQSVGDKLGITIHKFRYSEDGQVVRLHKYWGNVDTSKNFSCEPLCVAYKLRCFACALDHTVYIWLINVLPFDGPSG